MKPNDHRPQSTDVDPAIGQVRPDPNQELVHQHDSDRDPLDEAIIHEHEEHECLDGSEEGIMAKDRNLNPPPVDEYD